MNERLEKLKTLALQLVEIVKDPNRPVWQRMSPPIGVLILLSLLLTCTSSGSRELPARLPDDAMGGGQEAGSGLGEEASKSEKLLAKLPDEERPSEFDVDDLGLEEFDSEEQRLLKQREEALKKEEAEDARATTELKAKRTRSPFRSFPGIAETPSEVAEDSQGRIWIADKKALLRYDPKLEGKPEVLLEPGLYDREFNEEMKSISSLKLDAEDTAYLGFFGGELTRYKRFSWEMLTRAKEPIQGKISDIEILGTYPFIASWGVWRWDEIYQRAIGAENLRNLRATAFLRSRDNSLYVSGSGGVWKYDEAARAWNLVWKTRREDGIAQTLVERSDGYLLVGTRNGIVELSTSGVVSNRLLDGEVVTSIIEVDESALFVGTRQNGLFYWDGLAWYRIGFAQGLADRIDSLLLDSEDRLWISASKEGLFTASLKVAEAWAKRYPEQIASDVLNEPKVYPSACDAAADLLKGVNVSNDVTVEVLDGKTYVFFNRKQICPSGSGYRRADGTVVLQQGWLLTVYKEGNREVIEVPKEYAADQSTALLLDSKNRLWIGTTDFGVYEYSDTSWKVHGADAGLLNNAVRTIEEDTRGRIWIASNPGQKRETRKFSGAPLTVFSAKGRTTFSPANDFPSWAANDLIPLAANKMFVAHKDGFSIVNVDGNIHSITEREKIKPQHSYAASIDGTRRIWITHLFFGDGISVFDGKQVRNITDKDGLFAQRIVSSAHDRHGRVWLLSSTGQVGVYPQEQLLNKGKVVEIPDRKKFDLSR